METCLEVSLGLVVEVTLLDRPRLGADLVTFLLAIRAAWRAELTTPAIVTVLCRVRAGSYRNAQQTGRRQDGSDQLNG
jgi:hypothetical protein